MTETERAKEIEAEIRAKLEEHGYSDPVKREQYIFGFLATRCASLEGELKKTRDALFERGRKEVADET